MLQQGRAVAAAESFRRAVDLEPGNSTYRAQLENVRAQLRPPPTPESAQGASRPVPTGPSFTERVTAGLVRQVTAAQGWWLNLSADQQRLIAAGVAVAGVLLLYFIYTWLFG